MSDNDIVDLKAAGSKIIIEIDKEADKSAGGIQLIESDVRREQDKRYEGILVKVGDIAFYDMVREHSRIEQGFAPRVGDKIFFVKFSGIEIKRGDKYYRIMDDENVYAYEEQ